MRREFIWSIFLFVFIFFATGSFSALATQILGRLNISNTATVLNSEDVLIEKNSDISDGDIKLAFVGDIMLDRGVRYSVYKNLDGDYSRLFSEIKDRLRSYDILFANLEGPVSDGGVDQGGIYSFRMEPRAVPILKDAGFDILSVANNHTFNWGRTAFTDTLQLLSDNNIVYVGGGFTGSGAYKAKIINVEGVRIAFLAFSEFKVGGVNSSSTDSGIAVISEKEIKDSVSRAKLNSDLVIVSFHFGEEYQSTPNFYQKNYAKLAIDSGADLIVGHHPHVMQTLEQYKNVYIAYSLGNFIFDQAFSAETMKGGLLEVMVNSKTKQIGTVNLKKVQLNKFFQIESVSL